MAEEVDKAPKIHNRSYPGGNATPVVTPSGVVIGWNNVVPESATGIFIMGSYNGVGEQSQNITILNSSGCIVAGGLVNVFIYNSSGVTVTESNTIVQNGVIQSSPSTGGTSGTYTPTLTNTTNVTSSSAKVAQWMRVGNVVTVSGRVDINPAIGSTLTQLEVSLPIASAFTGTGAGENCAGVFGSRGTDAGALGTIYAEETNNTALFEFMSNPAGDTKACLFTFTYLILI